MPRHNQQFDSSLSLERRLLVICCAIACAISTTETRKWASEAQQYLELLSKIIPKVKCRVESYQNKADKPVSVEINEKTSLSIEPIGFTRTPLAWTKKSGNAQMLPTFTLLVTLPAGVISAKDYLNNRYIDVSSEKIGNVEYVWPNGTARSPCLRLVPPSAKRSPKFQVSLSFGMGSIDWIPKLRLVPNRSNIKSKSVSMKTQRYNHSLVSDARHLFEDKHLATLAGCPNVEATLVLIQIWALQRGLWRNHDGWTKENVAMFLFYLLRTQKMNSRMTPLQLFTVVLQTWADTNWIGEEQDEATKVVRAAHSQTTQFHKSYDSCRSVLVLPLEDSSEKETIQQSELGQLYAQQTEESPLSDCDPSTLISAYASKKSFFLGPVFLDPTLTFNYLGDVSPNYMKLLSSHAKKSLKALIQPRTSFSFLFMLPARFWNQWDLYAQIPTERSEDWEVYSRNIVEKIELALGNRIRGLRVLSTGNGNASNGSATFDEFPTQPVGKTGGSEQPLSRSPTGTNKIVIGLSVNPETSQRAVDRGPPSDMPEEVEEFKKLWGDKAQLRRFKDGAIVQAVVWNDRQDELFQNEGKLNGGYVSKIIKHILRLHFTKASVQFSLPTLLSLVDGVASKKGGPFDDPYSSHQDIMSAFNSLSDFLRKNSQPPRPGSMETNELGLPLPIDAVEPLAPCLRYSELYPPVPHPFLGGSSVDTKKVSGALLSEPVLIQIRFGSSSKWPNDLKAIGAAKTAMLIQLAEAIETRAFKDFEGPVHVSPTYADVGFRGYCFRILIRADPELRMLRGLSKPSPLASAMQVELTRKHLIGSRHHSTIHAVHTLHPSAASVVRMVQRWLASHLLSGLISTEVVELLVAKVYSDDEALLEVPGTLQAGFLKFLRLLANHDWAREPLIVDPRGHIDSDCLDTINSQFEALRGVKMEDGLPMYIIAPYDKGGLFDDTGDFDETDKNDIGSWRPSVDSPEWVVVNRAVTLAQRSYDFMLQTLKGFVESELSAAFNESAAQFKAYDVLFRVSPEFVPDVTSSATCDTLGIVENDAGVSESAYTRSMKDRFAGPKPLRRKLYRNLRENGNESVLPVWRPVSELVEKLRERFGDVALFFYNESSPEVISLLWRPQTFKPVAFSAMTSDYARPIGDGDWKSDSLIVRNERDLLRDMSQYYLDIVTTVKVLDHHKSPAKRRKTS
eukprot:scaffold4183_cov137-Cylindrotheca_fusiformis.AAC.8